MIAALRQEVIRRAGGRCEYCRMPQELDIQPFQIDHVRAQKHGGLTEFGNLALSCLPCNSYKGPNVAGYDPESGEIVALFNPRTDQWARHFAWDGPTLIGKTSMARVTIAVLRINAPERVEHRRLLLDARTL